MKTDLSQELSGRTKVFYGIANVAFGLLASTVGFFLMFYYTDVAKVSPAIAGSAMLVSKFTWDAINDPLFGWISDRTRSRWGRRRVYMLFGAIPFGLSTWLLFSIPQHMTGTTAFLVVCGTYLLFDTFRTLVSMPWSAMSAELSTDYNERTGLMAVSNIFSVVGYIIGAALITMIVSIIGKAFGFDLAGSWSGMALILGVFVAAVVLISALGVRDNPAIKHEPSKMPAWKSYLQAFRNKPFVLYLLISMLASFVLTLVTGMIPYFLIYQLGMKTQLTFVMMAFLLTVVIFIYPMKMLADRINKGPAFGVGLGLASLALLLSFLLPHQPTPLIYPVVILAGVGFAAQWVFPGSMMPDVIEIDEKATGERHEGIYYGINSFLGKLVSAFGSAVIGWGLAAFGYVESAEQTTRSLLGIRILYGLIPAVVLLVCIPLLVKYPITRKSHVELVRDLQAKKKEE